MLQINIDNGLADLVVLWCKLANLGILAVITLLTDLVDKKFLHTRNLADLDFSVFHSAELSLS